MIEIRPHMTHRTVRIWYVAGQRLCNFDCPYCVSVGTWSKSSRYNWESPDDYTNFTKIVHWIGTRPFDVQVRLGSLGEPFASNEFLEQAGWLTRQPQVKFVELVSNGSLLSRRLPKMEKFANVGKLSLWLTYHDGEMDVSKFIDNARFSQEEYGCFVVINALLFPNNAEKVNQVGRLAREADLRFNVDLGYDPEAPSDTFVHGSNPDRAVPALDHLDAVGSVRDLGGDVELTEAALQALRAPRGKRCRAGHDSIFIGIDGEVYPCSRYHVIQAQRFGNVLENDFQLDLRQDKWSRCEAVNGCCNKEDFLNLELAESLRSPDIPSLGWTGS